MKFEGEDLDLFNEVHFIMVVLVRRRLQENGNDLHDTSLYCDKIAAHLLNRYSYKEDLVCEAARIVKRLIIGTINSVKHN